MRSRLIAAAALTIVLVLAGVPGRAEPARTARYIVVLRPSVADPAAAAVAAARRLGGSVGFVYRNALKGFTITVPVAAARALSLLPNVASVEADGVMQAVTTQGSATWGLDRIDQRNLPLSGTFTYAATGTGVTAYIIDSGIRYSHSEFSSASGSRAVKGTDTVTPGGNASDCYGHGTHVAGTVGGKTFGVAKGVKLISVRVLDCGGTGATSGVIAGVDWVTQHHTTGPAVANMSLGGGASSALDTAVRNSINDGIAYAIAAGNGNILGMATDACNTSPARVTQAMTISATDRNDKKASWANYGNCVDWFAPGVSITSAWYTSDIATDTISGTSMSAPHTAGVAALYLQSHASATPQQVRDALSGLTTKGIVTSSGGGFLGPSKTANNHLLFTNL